MNSSLVQHSGKVVTPLEQELLDHLDQGEALRGIALRFPEQCLALFDVRYRFREGHRQLVYTTESLVYFGLSLDTQSSGDQLHPFLYVQCAHETLVRRSTKLVVCYACTTKGISCSFILFTITRSLGTFLTRRSLSIWRMHKYDSAECEFCPRSLCRQPLTVFEEVGVSEFDSEKLFWLSASRTSKFLIQPTSSQTRSTLRSIVVCTYLFWYVSSTIVSLEWGF